MTPMDVKNGKAAIKSCQNSDYSRTAGVTLHTTKPFLILLKGGHNNVLLF